ncbi:hypothetical protein [Phytomonospora endophytica]|uniref:Uncharacterized protein n=1 Tax=Phytomonospora endophytica TaxID=714109 RepID=A0A841FEM2_9ACTN|nr:hypothetical protein [Phytomonospora endophytica]MBB6033995.1 hypothetical protein [Phytomonospora endophytica]GIG64484.1 hypothetical protein Pen01_07790 [Phytomonospora endophytica]
MPATQVSQLFAELDPLPYPGRMRLLAARARELAAAGTLPALLGELWSGDADHRHLAVTMGAVSRDEASVLTGLRDEDPRIMARTLRVIHARPVDPGLLAEVITDAPAELRARVYRLARHAAPVAEALIGPVRTRFGDREAAKLLAGCATGTVARLLPELGASVASWTVLARRHPGPVLDETRRLLGALPDTLRSRWWSRHGPGVLTAAGAFPERVAELLETHPGLPSVSGLNIALGRIAAADPARAVRLLTDTEQTAARRQWRESGVLRRIAKADTPVLAAFIGSFTGDDGLAELLDALPPARRGELFDAVTAEREESPEPLATPVLAALPHERRVAEARRCLALPVVAGDEDAVLRYTAFLPFAEAHPVLLTATRRHESADRAEAYRLLIACAVRSSGPGALAVALNSLDRLRNEQDPVRAPVLAALASVPPARFHPADAAVLGTLVRDAVEARDSSWATRAALGDLAARILGAHSGDGPLLAWATGTFDLLFGSGTPELGRLDRVLRKGQERDFSRAVLPWVEAGVRRSRFEPLFAVASALGRRARGLGELQRLLREACDPGNVVPVITRGVHLWLDDPKTRAARVEEIVRGDTSTVTLPIVWSVLCGSRTDLIDLVLDKAPSGRHIAEGARWVPDWAWHLGRWLPRQRAVYAKLLAAVAADAGTPQHRRAAAVQAAARIPGHGWTPVTKYVDSPNVALAEAALGALAWTDRPADALELLLAHVDGDRAHVAVHAAGRAARFTPPSRLAPLLGGVLTEGRKVTARKGAARLLSGLSVPGAMDALAGVWRPEPHRDLKVAIVSAVRGHLDDPRAWQILDDAVGDDEQAVALAVVGADPLGTAPRHRGRYGGLVAAACDHPRVTVAAAAWSGYPLWASWAPDAGARIAAAVADLDERAHWRTAAQALAELVVVVPDTDAVAVAVAALLAAGNVEAPDRDRPAAQRLGELVRIVMYRLRWAPRESVRPALVGAGGLLAAAPDHLDAAARLLIASVDLASADADAIAGALGPVADLFAGRPIAAFRAREDLLGAISTRRPDSPRALWSAAETLAGRGDVAGGFFALALVEGGAGFGAGWSSADPPWRGLLSRLRRHAEPEVRAAALDVFTLTE